jgi:hypothetical protein
LLPLLALACAGGTPAAPPLTSDAAAPTDVAPAEVAVVIDAPTAPRDTAEAAAPRDAIPETPPPHALAFFDDFEAAAPGGPPAPATWTVGAPNVTGTGTLAIDDAQHHSGTRAVKVSGQGGYSNHVFFTSSSALAAVGPVIWGRFYVRLSEPLGDGHVTFLAMKDAADGGKYLRMGGQAKILMWNRESDDATLPALSPAGIALSRALPAAQWLCIELMVDGAAGHVRTWVDGAEIPGLAIDGASTPDVDEQWLRKAGWRPALKDFALGWESYAGQAMTLWFDDVALDAQRIGCQ